MGWLGDEPPFRCPVFVLTHRKRDSIEMSGGTTFHFVDSALQDVRVGGGARTAREFLKAGFVDRLHVAIAPILLGRGINLWNDLRSFEDGYQVGSEVAESGTIHVTFSRR
jgi:dihydrofolate reductase